MKNERSPDLTHPAGATATSTSRGSIGVFALIVVLSAWIQYSGLNDGHAWGGDFAAYIHQAKAIVDSDIRELNALATFRTENSTTDKMIGPRFYPWGFPLILSVLLAIVGENLFAMKVMLMGFVLGSQVLTYFLLRGRLTEPLTLSITLIMGISPWLIQMKNHIISDLPNLFFVLLVLVIIRRIVMDRQRILSFAVDHLLLGLAILFAIMIRTQSIALIPTLAVVQLLQAWNKDEGISPFGLMRAVKRLHAIQILPYVIVVAGIIIVKLLSTGTDTSYLSSGHFLYSGFGDFARQIASNVLYYSVIPSPFLAIDSKVNALLLMPLAVLGVTRCKFRRDHFLLIFVIFHMCMLLIFPFRQGVRFILPVIPIYLYFVALGAMQLHILLAHRLTTLNRLPNLGSVAVITFTAYLTISSAFQWVGSARAQEVGPYMPTGIEVFNYIHEETKEDSVIVFFKPRVLMLRTERRGILLLESTEILDGRADFMLIYTRPGPDYLEKLNVQFSRIVSDSRRRFELVFKNADFELYRILTDPQN